MNKFLVVAAFAVLAVVAVQAEYEEDPPSDLDLRETRGYEDIDRDLEDIVKRQYNGENGGYDQEVKRQVEENGGYDQEVKRQVEENEDNEARYARQDDNDDNEARYARQDDNDDNDARYARYIRRKRRSLH